MATKKYESSKEFLRDGAHLPAPLKDFHDQKDVFKSLHAWFEPSLKKEDSLSREMPSWVAGQIYTIDYFLRFMALHGWTLQRSRTKLDFADLAQTIKERQEQEYAATREYMSQLNKPGVTPTPPA